MNIKMMLAAAGTAAISVSILPSSAEAAALKWRLHNAVLNNSLGTEVTGTFLYDDSTEIYSDLNIDGLFADYTGNGGNTSSPTQLTKNGGPGVGFLRLVFAESLNGKSVGDIVELDVSTPFPFSQEFSIPNGPSAGFRFTSGSVKAVPTPALLPGLLGLGVASLRRKQEEKAEVNA